MTRWLDFRYRFVGAVYASVPVCRIGLCIDVSVSASERRPSEAELVYQVVRVESPNLQSYTKYPKDPKESLDAVGC